MTEKINGGEVTFEVDSPQQYDQIPNDTYFKDNALGIILYRSPSGNIINPWLTNIPPLKINLSASQINSGLNTAIDCGIICPSTHFVSVLGASFNYDQGDGQQTFTTVFLKTKTKIDSQASFIFKNSPVTSWGQFVIYQNGDSLIEGQGLEVSFDSDSIGTGTADIYITYQFIEK